MMGAKNIVYALCALLVGYLLIGVIPEQVSQLAAPTISQKTDGQLREGQEILGAENDTVTGEIEKTPGTGETSDIYTDSGEYRYESVVDKRVFQIKPETILFWFADFLVAFGIYFVARRHFS